MGVNNEITIVIVIYNSSNIIFDCLKSLDNFKIIIVDNGKNSKVLTQLQQKNNITIVSPGKNIGMGRGANFAFQSIKTDFFLLLSPDTKMDENSSLVQMYYHEKIPSLFYVEMLLKLMIFHFSHRYHLVSLH